MGGANPRLVTCQRFQVEIAPKWKRAHHDRCFYPIASSLSSLQDAREHDALRVRRRAGGGAPTRARPPRAFRAARVSTRVSASSDPEEAPTERFTASMLQNVRQKVTGFETEMAISKLPTEETKASERRPTKGDLVSILFSAQTEEGEILQGMEDMEEALTFEVGGAAAMGNPLFLAFDAAVQGMVEGDQALVNASGGEYDPNLLFKVPMEHPEIVRLQEELDQPGKGGLHPGATVALSNGNPAVVARDERRRGVRDDRREPPVRGVGPAVRGQLWGSRTTPIWKSRRR